MSEKKTVFKPTPAQENAINAFGGSIVVSAAAGSGKTRVLVQRVIKLLTGENPVSADKMLILTFTNAAAAEMKMRISQEIDRLITENPDNNFYRRQQLLLPSADICTIDSFCSKVVRENFYRLGVSRDYRIGTTAELYELSRKIMSDIIEEYYTPPETGCENYEEKLERHKNFNSLSMLLSGPKLDNALESNLLKVYNKYTAQVFPEKWIKFCAEQYNPETAKNGKCISVLFDMIGPVLVSLRDCYNRAAEFYGAVEEQRDSAKKSILTALEMYDYYEAFLENTEELYRGGTDNYFAISKQVSEFKKSTVNCGNTKNVDIKAAASLLNSFGNLVQNELRVYACCTEEDFRESNERLYPIMKCLGEFLQKFGQRYFEAKQERKILDFHDLESLVVKLLYRYDEESDDYVITDFARETAEKYEHIMVDEYQDTNDIQESIFKAISRNEENLFVVGDVKQSIYRFREANPALFQKKCRNSNYYDADNPLFPALVVLDSNFRSRKGIIDSVNYIFGLLMSEKSGEIEYDKNHRLNTGIEDHGETMPAVELHIIEHKSQSSEETYDDEFEDEDREEQAKEKTEAVYCANLIKDITERGDTVYDPKSGGQRKITYGDICILMRGVKNTAHVYSAELEKCGIPAYTNTEFDLLERYEVKAALSYLKILNNPLSDIDMVAAMMCPVFGFTPDELALIKSVKSKYYYGKLLKIINLGTDNSDNGEENDYADIGEELIEKCRNFTDTMKKFRDLSAAVPTDRLLREFFEDTGFIAVMNAMPDGNFRVQNLRKLMNFISEYENSIAGGLMGFVRHVKYLEETQSGIKVSDNTPVNAVRIMTIHRSKGLEFPVCILAGMQSKEKSDKEKINYHSELGMGMMLTDTENFLKFNTLQNKAVETAGKFERKSELLRLLYVALTRPKDRLIMLSTVKVKTEDDGKAPNEKEGYYRYINRLAQKIIYDEKTGHILPDVVMSCETLSDWVVMCALLNGKMTELRNDAGVNVCDAGISGQCAIELPSLECGAEWKYVHAENVERNIKQPVSATNDKTDMELEKFLQKRFSENKNDISTMIPSKVSASMLAHKNTEIIFAASSTPSFVNKTKVSPTERGTATHAFLQYADINMLYKEISETGAFENSKAAVEKQKLMSKEQIALISDDDIIAFSENILFKRMVNAERLYREYRFTVSIPAELVLKQQEVVYDKSAEGIKSILQGAVDCIIEESDGLVIVDYKTDNVKDPQKLKDMYGIQLELYKEAANQIFDKPVKECYIYSLHCGCEISVK